MREGSCWAALAERHSAAPSQRERKNCISYTSCLGVRFSIPFTPGWSRLSRLRAFIYRLRVQRRGPPLRYAVQVQCWGGRWDREIGSRRRANARGGLMASDRVTSERLRCEGRDHVQGPHEWAARVRVCTCACSRRVHACGCACPRSRCRRQRPASPRCYTQEYTRRV